MLENPILFNNYRPFLDYYDALVLETCSKGFRYKPKYRYFSSYCLINRIFKVSGISYSHSYYNELYNLLSRLTLLDFSIFIVGSNVNCSHYLQNVDCNLRNVFQCNENYFYGQYSYSLSNILKYTSILSKYLSTPSVLIKHYLSLNNPDHFTKKYKIDCNEQITRTYSPKIESNLMVALQNILHQHLWENNILYNCILCKNTEDLMRMDYFKNPTFKTFVTNRFQKLNKSVLYNAWIKLTNISSTLNTKST